MTHTSFIAQCTELLNGLPPLTGDSARLAHFLSEATNRLAAIQGSGTDIRVVMIDADDLQALDKPL